MDLLKKEMERKKKALKDAKESQGATVTTKGYYKAGELRRLQEDREDEDRQKRLQQSEGRNGRKRQRLEEEAEEEKLEVETKIRKAAAKEKEEQNRASAKKDVSSVREIALITPTQVTEKFRSLGLPVRLFGERTAVLDDGTHEDHDRLLRLQDALEKQTKTLASLSEKDEYRLGSGHGIRNPFLEKDEGDARAIMQEEEEEGTDGAPTAKETVEEADEDDSSDPHKRIYKFFKGLLKTWEEDLGHRSEEIKRSVPGKNETKTLKQCKDYIRPLFKLCKNRRLEESLTKNLVRIVEFCQEGEFVKAHDAYLDVAIGRAAWPIGVTMVGIHARTGRAKIESQNVAHVMNSELQRKYLTSVKRLMTYYQKKRVDVNPSKKVQN
jgi:pre-mRNA-splicing factor 18